VVHSSGTTPGATLKLIEASVVLNFFYSLSQFLHQIFGSSSMVWDHGSELGLLQDLDVMLW